MHPNIEIEVNTSPAIPAGTTFYFTVKQTAGVTDAEIELYFDFVLLR